MSLSMFNQQKIIEFVSACSIANMSPLSAIEFFHKIEHENSPERIVIVDGELLVNTLPILRKTETGHLQIRCSEIKSKIYSALLKKLFVDPGTWGQASRTDSLHMSLSGPNMVLDGSDSPIQSFRLGLWSAMKDTVLYGRQLSETLYSISPSVYIETCPMCGASLMQNFKTPDLFFCSACKARLYPTDALNLHDFFSNHSDFGAALSRCLDFFKMIVCLHHYLGIPEADRDGYVYIVDRPLSLRDPHMAQQLHDFISAHGIIIVGIVKQARFQTHLTVLQQVVEDYSGSIINAAYLNTFLPDYNFRANEHAFGQLIFLKLTAKNYYSIMLPVQGHTVDAQEVDSAAIFANYREALAKAASALHLYNQFNSELTESNQIEENFIGEPLPL